MMKINARTSLSAIRLALLKSHDGQSFIHVVGREREIKRAALSGCLLWTPDQLRTPTIDARPTQHLGISRQVIDHLPRDENDELCGATLLESDYASSCASTAAVSGFARSPFFGSSEMPSSRRPTRTSL